MSFDEQNWNEVIQRQNAVAAYKQVIEKITGQDLRAELHTSPEGSVYAFSIKRGDLTNRKERRKVETEIHNEVEKIEPHYVGMVGVLWVS